MPTEPDDFGTTATNTRASYNAALARFERDTIRHVAEEMSGEDPVAINAVLLDAFAGRLPGSELDHLNLQRIASAIANRSYHDWAFA
jgi:hypothetical protein